MSWPTTDPHPADLPWRTARAAGATVPGVDRDQTCTGSACTCLAGTQCGTACVDVASDPRNCGACGAACTTQQVCSGGGCQAVCAGGLTLCGGSCVDLATSATNCGACGVSCSGGKVCNLGQCGCPLGKTLCMGVCRDTGSDRQHCGTCENNCMGKTVCALGQCVPR